MSTEDCEICAKNPAAVHYTEIADARISKLFICRACAEARGLLDEPTLEDLMATVSKPAALATADLVCRRCGLDFAEFQARGRLGCPGCYDAFGAPLGKLLHDIHGSNRHRGKEPESRGTQGARLGQLRRELELAVRTEDYERAATLRDDIRAAEQAQTPSAPATLSSPPLPPLHAVGDLLRRPSIWLRGDGPESDVVLSTRIRFARNLAERIFPQRASADGREGLLREILGRTEGLGLVAGELRLALEPLQPLERRILGERHLLSQELVDTPQHRGVVIAGDESVSFMINEEDHLRIQALCSGLGLRRAHEVGAQLEATLAARLDLAYDARLGFLTACPTNTGTGMRASVLLHLPGLVLDNRMEAELTALHARGVTVRGHHGEGSTALGNFFQVSNAVTLGSTEEEILARLEAVVHDLIVKEKQAREDLLSRARTLLEDRIWRSFGILRHARKLNAQETLQHASMLRLGCSAKILELSPDVLNDILTFGQEAHTEVLAGADGDALRCSVWRAEAIRRRLQGSQN